MKRIGSIQALRAFAAMSVVLTHISFIQSGSFSVDIFFIISGFLMMYATENGIEKYWTKKFLRIVPFYWFMTCITAIAVFVAPNLFHSYEVSWSYLFKSLLFIPYVHNGIYQPVLGLGYTLNYEMFFYLIFYISVVTAKKIGGKKWRGIICGVLIFLLVSFIELNLPMPFYFWCNSLLINFVLGILIYYLFQKIDLNVLVRKNRKGLEYLSGIVALFIMAFLWAVPIPDSGSRILLWSLPSAFLFIAVYIFYYEKPVPSLFLSIGNISFYIYLTHPYCIRLTENIMNRIYHEKILCYVMTVLIGLISSIVCGYISCRVFASVEKWFDKIWRGFITA